MSISELRRRVIRVAHRLDQRGIFGATDGNLSVVLDDGTLLVTPTSSCKGWIVEDELVLLTPEGEQIGGRASSELPMHQAIYRARPDVRAIVHAHPVEAAARAVAGLALEELILSEAALTIGRVPVVGWAMPGEAALARLVAEAAAGADAILLRFHGAVTVGRTIEEAAFRMETLEHVCAVERVRRDLGRGDEVLPADAVRELEERRRRS